MRGARVSSLLTERLGNPRVVKGIVVLIVVSCFGPYVNFLGYGIRTEQIIIYGLFVLMVPFFLKELRFNSTGTGVLALLLIQFGVSIAAFILVASPDDYSLTRVLADTDTLLLPIVTIVLIATLSRPSIPRSDLLIVASRTFVIMCTLNVLGASIQSRMTPDTLLVYFWTSSTADWSVAELANLSSRYSGVFNQPAEVGFAYGLALILIIFSARFSVAWSLFFATAVSIGGLMAATKVFYGCAAVLIVYGAFTGVRTRKILRETLFFLTVSVSSVSALAAMGLLSERLARFNVSNFSATVEVPVSSEVQVSSEGASSTLVDALTMLTAGRLGNSGSLSPIFEGVNAASPLIGFGVGGWAKSYDSTWAEAMVFGGWLGVALSAAIFVILLIKGFLMCLRPLRSSLLIVLTGSALIASLGIGVLTANRSSTIFWIIVTLLAFGRQGLVRHTLKEKSYELAPSESPN